MPYFFLFFIFAVKALWAQPVELRYASSYPASNPINQIFLPKVRAQLEALSAGQLTLTIYPSGTLGVGTKTQLRLIQNGGADAGDINTAFHLGRIIGFGGIKNRHNHLEPSLESWTRWEKNNIKGLGDFIPLGVLQVGGQTLHTNFPLNHLSALKGKKIRAVGSGAKAIERFGAVAVGLVPPMIPEALARGSLDGVIMDYNQLNLLGLSRDLTHHLEGYAFSPSASVFVINRDFYQSLNEQQKSALDKVRGEWFTRQLAEDLDQLTHRLQQDLKRAGHYFYSVSDDDKALLNQ